MAKGKEGSVAPKERINIVYRPETGDMQEDVELPLKFLVIGDFTGREDPDTTIEERPPVSVDKDNFDNVLAAYDVRLAASVPNQLSDDSGADELPVQLSFKSMKDFGPDSVCQQVPELRKLIELRDALTGLKGSLSNIPAFRKRIQAILDDPEQQQQLMSELGLETKPDGQ